MLTDEDVDDFLEHVGVKGMHWGVRGTRRAQKRIDRTQRIATGTASTKDRVLGSAFTKKGANRQLQRGANQQAKINAGKLKATNVLTTLAGVKVKELNFHKKGDAKAKMDNGQKAAIGALVAIGALNIASAASRRA